MANPFAVVRRAFGRVAQAFRSAGGMFQGYGGQGYGWRLLLPGSQFDYEGAAGDLWRNSAIAACLGWIKKNFPEPVLEVVTEEADGSKKPVPKHPVVQLLNKPNKFYDRYMLWAAVSLSIIVDGNAYLRKVRSPAGKVVELWWIPHWLIWPRWLPDGTQFIGWYDYQVNGRIEKIPVDDVIHIRSGVDPRDDRRGFSEVKQAVRAVCGLNECDTYTAAILRNMGIVGVVISPGSPEIKLEADDIDPLRDQFRERFTSEQRGQPFFGTRMFKVEKLGMTPEELRLDKIPARLEDQICAAIGVPAMVVGLTSGAQHKTYANYGEARQAAYEDCLIPLQKMIAEVLTRQLLETDFGDGDCVRWDYAGVQCLSENETELAGRVGTLYSQHKVIKRSEAREALGYDWDAEDEVYFDEASPKALPAPGGNPPDVDQDQLGGVEVTDDDAEEAGEGEAVQPARAKAALQGTVTRSQLWAKIDSVMQRLDDALDRRSRARRPGRARDAGGDRVAGQEPTRAAG